MGKEKDPYGNGKTAGEDFDEVVDPLIDAIQEAHKEGR